MALDPLSIRVRLLLRSLVESLADQSQVKDIAGLVELINTMPDNDMMAVVENKMDEAKLSFVTFIVSKGSN